MRTATRTGQMLNRLYGEPAIVIGIARSGTAPARAFADGSGAKQSIALSLPRPSSTGFRAKLRQLWVKLVPVVIRQLYKKLFFHLVVQMSDNLGTAKRTITEQQLQQLKELLVIRDEGPVIVVDDSIDSGGTIQNIVQTIRELDPQAKVIVFALASTLGRVIADNQYTLVSGEIAHFVDGDLAELNSPDLLGKPIDATASENAGEFSAAKLQLFLDLDGTLTTDSFRDAINCLARLYWDRRAYFNVIGLAVIRLAKKLRLIRHSFLKKNLDSRIKDLKPDALESYFERLADRLRRHARPALAAVATAPSVHGVIVTAALDSYRPAIELAFNLEVISGSGRTSAGDWQEIGADQKSELITRWRDVHGKYPALLVGDTLVDALSGDSNIQTIILPEWDRTGLSTLLGLPCWWQTTKAT